MFNQLFVLINLIGITLFSALLSPDLKITHAVPASMRPGTETRVTVTIEKGDLAGFAKLQIDLPPGMTATAIETKGASFTFADGKAKFIWMSLPSSPSFQVSYNLIAAADVSGVQPINGRLSYIEDNERKSYEMATVTVDLGEGAPVPAIARTVPDEIVSAAGAAPVEEPAANAAAEEAPPAVAESPVPPAPVASLPPAPQEGTTITASRTVTLLSANEVLVEMTVNKGEIRGFGKLQETIPAGFTATEKRNDESIFTAQDRIVKFVWLNLPARSELKIAYKLRTLDDTEQEHTVTGEFGYLLNDETRKHTIDPTRFRTGTAAFAALEELPSDGTAISPVNNKDASLGERPADQGAAQVSTGQKPVQSARVPSPETGITYKVQITAAHREVGSAYFKARHRYEGAFSIERHEGWIKYVTGRHAEYKEARDQRESFVRAGHQFPGPFVTAYNNGERITVQEALMISRQQWVQ